MKPQTGEEALAFFAGLPPSDVRPGLERMGFALAALEHPEQRVTAVHVAGTNGKGSTCAFLESLLRAQGRKTGLYTSPHLVRVNERFQVRGVELDDATLGARLLEVLQRLPDSLALTYFELGTLLAFWHFAREQVDVAVLETGLGGRLDATVLCRPKVTAVTALARDHCEWLGDTLQEIAAEKAGIFKPGVPAVVAAQEPAEQDTLARLAREVGAPLSVEGQDFRLRLDAARPGLTWTGRAATLDGLELGLAGAHQVHNAAVALACFELLQPRGAALDGAAVRAGLAGTCWPGRLELVARAPRTVLDGAHNPHGVQALCAALEALYPGQRPQLVFGVLADKQWEPMARALFARAAHVHLCPLPSPRALVPAQLAGFCAELGVGATVHPAPAEALGAARAAAGEGGLVLGAGSLLLVGALRAQLAPAR